MASHSQDNGIVNKYRKAAAIAAVLPCLTAVAQAAIHATIHVDASKTASYTIPQTIFGTFLEPIGHSTYGGLWAQILENPSFEENLWSAPAVRQMLKDQPELELASELGLPLPWEPLVPNEKNRYEPRWSDAANSSRSLLVMGLPDHEVGVRQRVYLPVYRVGTYNGAVYLKVPEKSVTVEISLRRRNPESVLAHTTISTANREWKRYPFSLQLPQGAVQATEPVDFVISVPHDDRVLIDEASLYPSDAIDGLDPEMVAMSRDLKTPLVRFGGNFTSAYHWRDGIGPRDKRVNMLNIAWGIPEYNEFGTDEFLDFCKRIGAQPQIALNLGTGTPREAGEWVRYVNKEWNGGRGGLLWELGNELWGNWQVGYPTLEQIAPRTKAFSQAVHEVDPHARLIATGQDPDVYQKWNAAQLGGDPKAFDYLSTHFVVGSENLVRHNPSDEFAAKAAFALPVGIESRLRDMAKQINSYDAARGRVKTAFTEWLFWAPEGKSPRFDDMGGAICTGGFLNMLLRTADIVPISDMTGLIEFGGIWKKKGRVYGVPAYYVFKMFSATQPRTRVETETDVERYDIHEGNKRIPDIEGVPYLDVVAAFDATKSHLMLFCVNRHLRESIDADVDLAAFAPKGDAQITSIHSASITDENTAEKPLTVVPSSQKIPAAVKFRHSFPPASVTVISLEK